MCTSAICKIEGINYLFADGFEYFIRAWTFWQYSNRGKLNGYNGKEKFIDMNVFKGSEEEFLNFAK